MHGLTAVELRGEVAVLDVAHVRIEIEGLLQLVVRVGRHLVRVRARARGRIWV